MTVGSLPIVPAELAEQGRGLRDMPEMSGFELRDGRLIEKPFTVDDLLENGGRLLNG